MDQKFFMSAMEAVGIPIVDEDNPLPEVPSPFLPDTKIQFAIDSTSIGNFKTCPRLYQYENIEGWQPRDKSIHLKFGGLYHEALANYDHCRFDGLDHDESVFQAVKALLDEVAVTGYKDVSDEKASVKAKSLHNLLRSIVWYLDQFPTETDPARTVALKNGKPAVELSFRFELDWGPIPEQPYILCGHLDRVVEYQGHLFVSDRKTTNGALTDWYFDQFNPNNQMSLYSIAGQIVVESPVKGVIIDAAEVKEDYTNFARRIIYRTPAQSEEWLNDLHMWLLAMEKCAVENHWPMNDKSCRGCTFQQVCEKDPSVRPVFLKSNFVQREPWNPLKPR